MAPSVRKTPRGYLQARLYEAKDSRYSSGSPLPCPGHADSCRRANNTVVASSGPVHGFARNLRDGRLLGIKGCDGLRQGFVVVEPALVDCWNKLFLSMRSILEWDVKKRPLMWK